MTNKKQNKPKEPLEIPEQEPDNTETHDLLIEPPAEEVTEARTEDFRDDLATEQAFKTQHSDGHTHDPQKAIDQGLTYTPPTDPPIVPSEEDRQGAEVAVGFAPSMEATNPDARRLPPHVEEGDLELRNDIYKVLHYNGKILKIDDISITVERGEVRLEGLVPTQEDIARIYSIVSDIDGVAAIRNDLRVSS